MITAGVKEARQRLTKYLAMVEKGEEIVISKSNEPIAIIKPLKKKIRRRLQSHKALRAFLIVKGRPLSDLITALREEEAY